MLKTLAAQRGGWFCRADARASGYTEFEIRDRLRSGRWLRLCRDGYVEAAAESQTEPAWQRRERLHRLTAAAVVHRMSDAVVSHQSAVVMHRLPVWDWTSTGCMSPSRAADGAPPTNWWCIAHGSSRTISSGSRVPG